MNRKSDGMPGWLTLWRGMKTLRFLVKGAELERARTDKDVHTGPNLSACIFSGMTSGGPQERGEGRGWTVTLLLNLLL